MKTRRGLRIPMVAGGVLLSLALMPIEKGRVPMVLARQANVLTRSESGAIRTDELRAFIWNFDIETLSLESETLHYLVFEAGAQFGRGALAMQVTVSQNGELIDNPKVTTTQYTDRFYVSYNRLKSGETYTVTVEVFDEDGRTAKAVGVVRVEGQGKQLRAVTLKSIAPYVYHVTVDGNGGFVRLEKDPSYEVFQYQEKFLLPTPSMASSPTGDGVFDGWEVNGVRMKAGETIEITEDTTLKVLWKVESSSSSSSASSDGSESDGALLPGAPEDPTAPDVLHYPGAARQDVAVAISKAFFPSAEKVILVQSMADADALSGSNVSQGRYPILYTNAELLFETTREEIKRLGAKEVIVMGGEKTIPPKIVQDVSEISGVEKVTRLGGADRYAVNVNTLSYFDAYDSVVFAQGLATADALAAAPYAHHQKAPLVLVKQSSVPEVTAEALKGRALTKATLIGGEKTVTKEAQDALSDFLRIDVKRISGKDRYELACEVAKAFEKPKEAFVTNGLMWSDALTASCAAQQTGSPLLLVRQSVIPGEVAQYIRNNPSLVRLHVLGGPASINPNMDAILKGLDLI
ncbi:MAG: cell wall-binding repeat-containing protein [Peptoniphilaceae bacterium]|nr:cell wall-binding repeat-containing protein [Peptoniphilaceae bacterium]MDY6085917.1 cell wall-binding repeat-containing protein [Peptoniphilaceae bacterium]